MEKTVNQKAWFLVIPVLVLVAFCAVIPLMTVVNYSVQDTFGDNQFFWAGLDWFDEMVHSDRLHDAFGRQLLFSAIILAIEVPLGIFIALNMPKKGVWASVCLILMALPLLIPFNVVGTIWQIFGRVDIGLLGHTLAALGIDYNYTNDAFDAWVTDHRDGCLALDQPCRPAVLCRAAIHPARPIIRPQRSTRPAAGRPFATSSCRRCRASCLIAILLRFMDSFMIYTEPFVVTGGGPGNSTTFLSIDLVKMAIGQFDLGPAAAFSLMYFLVILLVSWVFYTVMTNLDKEEAGK